MTSGAGSGSAGFGGREAHARQGPRHPGRRGGARREEHQGRGRRCCSTRCSWRRDALPTAYPNDRGPRRDRALDQRGDVAALVPAAGAGLRLGPGAPKALRELAGEPLLVHAVRRLPAPRTSAASSLLPRPGRSTPSRPCSADEPIVVEGGATRQESVAGALDAVPPAYRIVLVHDAARALTPPAMITRVAAAVRSGAPRRDSGAARSRHDQAGRGDGRVLATVDRRRCGPCRRPKVSTETADRRPRGPPTSRTDDAGLVEKLGIPVTTVPGDELAMKITRPLDLKIAEALL